MSGTSAITIPKSFDALLFNFESLRHIPELADVVTSFLEGGYKAVLRSPTSQTLYGKLVETTSLSRNEQDAALQVEELMNGHGAIKVLLVGLAALNAFLQANVTGPPTSWQDVFPFTSEESAAEFREKCLKSLEVDGISVYQYIPHLELFCLAKFVFTIFFPRIVDGEFRDVKWMRIRINTFHQRLLSGVSMGRLSESTTLMDIIEKDFRELESETFAEESGFGTDAKVMFLLEKAQIYILQGLDMKAKENVRRAKGVAGFEYELSGALGKRTKFQQNDISQLVVFAKSKDTENATENSSASTKNNEVSNGNVPAALDLNDDTLLESISFAKTTSDPIAASSLPPSLANLKPDDQPQLKPLDQITLLTEATIKDQLSPLDKLNREEILPYAVRVLNDKPTNWQIYTQALLVRSRIESHRSRTQERSVLQLQVIVDQIIADTQEETTNREESGGIPEIKVSSFIPRAKVDESAPVSERLKYIYPLSSPTRWEIETELAYAWAGAGSLVSALEIFKRLKLWAEVALCYHSVHQEDKARQIVRRQLFFSKNGPEMDKYDVDAKEVAAENWDGEIREPSPPHAPRLWCILGDLDQDPPCWEYAWEISKHRYARAQRTLGEYYSKLGDLDKAREGYMKATIVNRQNGDTWSRLGDIDLKVGNWDGAIIAFQQSIMIDETDAKTYSNLGSALLSKHAELVKTQKLTASESAPAVELLDDEGISSVHKSNSDPQSLLRQALSAYKRGASIAHTNWQIWDNVITIAGRLSPPSLPDLLLGMRSVLQIRAPAVGEFAVDIDVLRALVLEVASRERPENTMPGENPAENNGIYVPPRGSLARAVITMVESDVIPLITKRAELWVLVEKLSLYRKDYANALKCAERAWRVLKDGEDWLLDKEHWKSVVSATDNLVSAFENYGPMEMVSEGGDMKEVEKGWRMKARNAVRGVMSKGKEVWEDSSEWEELQGLLDGLKS
ncbi:probable TPR repeat-containing protein [Phialocephala subalpina]|uniref:Probable TPR repeat-containing protein n=1 Tax=Phialocephala subalpina TaxID=576137 RepID=A0A1L7XEF2_9HELO|nr:probable TPR repeat-containing protein [Phialocephala subalpina]